MDNNETARRSPEESRALSVGVKIAQEYRALGLTPMVGDHWTCDRRNNNVTGPFDSHAKAREMAQMLNDFVRRNARGNGFVENPFYVVERHGFRA